MTDIVKLALIAAAPPTVASLCSLLASVLTRQKLSAVHDRIANVDDKVTTVEKGLNGMKDQLVATTRKEAYAAGQKDQLEKDTR